MVLSKIKFLKFGFGAVALILASIVTTDYFSVFKIRELTARVQELENERTALILYAEQISAQRRVAQVNVVDQDLDAQKGPVTVLHWQQIRADGILGPREVVTVRGTQVYVEAMVVKFDYDLIGKAKKGDVTNLAMFRRAFGDGQSPSTGYPLDQTAPILRGEETEKTRVEAAMWKRFWDFVENPRLAKEYGIRVAQCEAPSVPMKKGQVWEVSLDAAGGLNIRKIGDTTATSQPVPTSQPATDLFNQPTTRAFSSR
ncbi:MAG: hypothetical protein IPK83_05520 [Planctomycetes bacterium]|nr:hypothetical protein [Planctomycetota bacterium]